MLCKQFGGQLRDFDTIDINFGSSNKNCRALAVTVVLERLLELAGRMIALELSPEKLEEGLLFNFDFVVPSVMDMVSTGREIVGVVCSVVEIISPG